MTILTRISGSHEETTYSVPDDAELVAFLAQLKASEDLSPAEMAEVSAYIEHMADGDAPLALEAEVEAEATADPLLASMDEITPTIAGDDAVSAPGGADPERTRQIADELAAEAAAQFAAAVDDVPEGDRMTNPSIEALARKGIELRGVDQNGLYHVYSREQGEVVTLSLQEITSSKGLLRLCSDYNWWVSYYFKGGKRSTAKEFLALPAGAYLMGIMNEKPRLRQALEYGAGFFFNREGRPIYHDGDALVANGHRLPVSAFNERGAYLRRVPTYFDTPWDEIPPVSAEERAGLIDVFNLFTFVDPMHREVLMGFVKLGIASGALDVRPMIWLVAGPDTGKSTILEEVLYPLIPAIAGFASKETTEPGIRQTLGVDARPFLFDEAAEIRPTIMTMIRTAYSTKRLTTVKGGADGQANEYRPRGMAVLASVMEGIDPNKDAGQDASRFMVLRMTKVDAVANLKDKDRDAYFAANVLPKIKRFCTGVIGEKLMKETIRDVDLILEVVQAFRQIVTQYVGEIGGRDVKNYGTMLAGAWLLRNGDRMPTTSEIHTYLRQFVGDNGLLAIDSHTAQTSSDSMAHRIMADLMGSVVREDIAPLARGLTVHSVIETVVDHAMVEGQRLDGPMLPHEKANKIINDLLKNKSAPDRMPTDDNAKRRAELHAALLWLYGHGLKVEWYPILGDNNRVQHLPALLIQGKGNDALNEMKKGEKGNWLAVIEQLPYALRTKGAESGTFPDGSRMPNPRRVFSDGKQGNYIMVPWCVIQGGTLPVEAAAPSFDDDDAGLAGQAAV